MSTATAPNMDRLREGDVIRRAMARRKREIRTLSLRDGLRLVAALLENPPDDVGRMRVGDLLCSIQRVRYTKAQDMLELAGLDFAWNHRIRTTSVRHGAMRVLTERQRSVLAGELRRRAA